MEVVVLALAALSPWAFGGVDPVFELAMAVGLAVLLVLWACVAVASGRFTWMRCQVAFALAAVFLVGLVQLVPLPPAVLNWLSPNTARLHAELVPPQPEVLQGGVKIASPPPANLPISFYPHATREELFHWLSVLVLFAAVRNQVASTASMRRLALVMLVNGCLLAVVGLAQFFSVDRNRVYGVYETRGATFGPFIDRNHFAAYLNMCLALGMSVLLTSGPSDLDRKRSLMQKPNALLEQDSDQVAVFSPLSVLHSPAQLWVCAALALMLAALVCSLSRGGVGSLLLALALAVGLRLTRGPRVRRLEFLVLPALLFLGLLAWLGFRPLETRLASMWNGDALGDTRWPLWVNLLTLVPRFPVLGTGAGTVAYFERLVRQPTDFGPFPEVFIERAHNDYLEALIEGGVVRFALTLLLVGTAFAYGFRALRRYAGRTPGVYAFGGLIGFLTIALHSGVEFSITTPAVACLAAVLVAQLVALDRTDPTAPPSASHSHVLWLRLNVPARAAVVTLAVLLGGVLVLHGWQMDRVHRLRLGAFAAMNSKSPDSQRAIDYVQAAAGLDPANAEVHVELGQLYLNARQKYLDDRGEQERHLLLAVTAAAAFDPRAALAAWPDPGRADPRLRDDLLVPGLQQMAIARGLCPLLPRPHMRFAAHAAELAGGASPTPYWRRALRLATNDPDLRYFYGLQLLRDNQPEDAWALWRSSLELSHKHLTAILDEAIPRLGPKTQLAEHLLQTVLPPKPNLLLATAERLQASGDDPPPTKPLLERGRAVLLAKLDDGPLTALEYYIKARCEHLLSADDLTLAVEAQRDYEQALAMPDGHPGWRLNLVRLLVDQRKWQAAAQQLDVLRTTAWTAEADDLDKKVRLQLDIRR